MVVADTPGRAVADVGIRDIELARCGRHLVFCDGTAAGSGDHRIVVGAGDGNTHLVGRRRTRAIRHRDLENIAVGLAGLQALCRVVVQRVGPVAVLVDNEIAIGPMVAADAPRRAIADIGIRDVELAARRRYLVFRHRAHRGAADNRNVIGPRDGDADLMRRGRARTIRYRDLEDVAVGFRRP